ncbi:MAG: type II secretion system F family protein [Synergistaceae bacterium]|jgi:type IV pilus assembly protein PilC|nr:type II secretion system F family protein [Synergistaceae bacterium]
MNFQYKARTKEGRDVEGQIEAVTQSVAIDMLRQKGLIPLSVKVLLSGRSASGRKQQLTLLEKMQRIGTVPGQLVMICFRQLATMIQAGLSLAMAIDIIVEQEKNPILKDCLLSVKSQIDQGTPMSQAMRQYMSIFTPMMISLVQAGEEGGILEKALDRVAGLLEKQQILRGKIKSAVSYPAFVVSFALLITIAFTVFVLPTFRKVFADMGVELPAVTLILFNISEFVTSNGMMLCVGSVSAIAGLVYCSKAKATKPIMDRFKLKLPVIKGLVLKASLARSTQTLASLVSAGVPVLRGLEMAREVSGNVVVEAGYGSLLEAAKRGTGMGDAARAAKIFPILVCQMIRIGEETGHLDEMLERVATWYDQELDEQIKGMTSMLEPALIIFIGGMVALIAVAIFGPMVSAISQFG